MPWSDLTKDQQTFLKTYLKASTWDFIFGTENSDVNKPTIASFETFEKLDQEYLTVILEIPADYAERTAMEGAASEAYDQRDAGDFDKAVKSMTAVVADTKRSVANLKDATLLLRTKAKPVVEGLIDDETDEINLIHARMMQRLVPAIPTRAEISGAQADGLALDQAVERFKLAIERRKKARLDFDNAFKTVKPNLEKSANFDREPFKRTDKTKDLKKVIADAAALLNDAEGAAKSDDEAVHLDLTSRLTEWNKTADQVDLLAAEAKAQIHDALDYEYQAIKDRIKDILAVVITAYSSGDQSALQPVVLSLTSSRDSMNSALSGTDSAEQLRLYDELDDVKAKMDEFDRLREIARDNREKDYFVSSGASAEQAQNVAKLRSKAPKVLESVDNTITKANKVLGTVEVTTQLIADREKLRADELTKWKDLGTEIKDLENQLDVIQEKMKQDLMNKFSAEAAEAEKLEKRIKALNGNTSTAAVNEVKLAQARIKAITDEIQDWAQKEAEKQRSVVEPLMERAKEAEQERETAGDEWRKQNDFVNAAQTKKRLLDAIAFGPLSPDRSNALDPNSMLRLTELYADNWEVADFASTEAGKSKNPGSVIKAAETVSGRIKDGFGNKKWNEETSKAYANNIITMSGNLPTDMVDELGAYLDNGGHSKPSPDMYRGKTYEEDGKNRAGSVGKKMVKSDGSLDLDGAMQGVMDVAFHPDSLKYPTPALAKHMYETVEYFRNSPTAEDKIKGITLPTDPGALALLEKGSGKTGSGITQETARQEVVNAMLTPVYQGKIGSCFATAGVVKLRQTDPDRALDLYSEIATKGTFTPKSTDPSRIPVPVPVVQNVPKDDNPLIRSLEFTIGTAAALEEDSNLKKATVKRSALAVAKVEAKIKPAEWNKVKAKLKTAIPNAFTYTYNSEVDISSNDGSSTKGGYQLVAKASKKGITSEDEYVKAVTPIVLAQIEASDMADTVTETEITDLVKSRDFLDAMKVDGKMPWELGSGGNSTEATKVLDGVDVIRDNFIPKSTTTENMATRTRRIMESLLTAFDGSTDDMAPIETGGMHTFNALPQDPSLAPLKKGGAGKIAENLDRELITKGNTIKNTAIPVERAAYMVEKQLRSLGKNAKGPVKKALEDAILAHRPTTALTPAALKTFMETATADYVDAIATQRADEWKAEEKKKNSGTDPSDDDYNKKVESVKKSAKGWVESEATNVLIADLDVPQFMIADTNWGGNVSHTFFVLCPDPATGAPQMYQREDPGGTLTPVTEDWIKTNWLQVH